MLTNHTVYNYDYIKKIARFVHTNMKPRKPHTTNRVRVVRCKRYIKIRS